jgi:hypothetical protein
LGHAYWPMTGWGLCDKYIYCSLWDTVNIYQNKILIRSLTSDHSLLFDLAGEHEVG